MTTEMIISLSVLAVVVFAFIIYLVYKIKTKGLRGAAIEFIVIAEESFKKGENEQKFEYVYNAVVALLPGAVRIFITESMVKAFIQKVFDEIKIALDYKNEIETEGLFLEEGKDED